MKFEDMPNGAFFHVPGDHSSGKTLYRKMSKVMYTVVVSDGHMKLDWHRCAPWVFADDDLEMARVQLWSEVRLKHGKRMYGWLPLPENAG